MGSKQNEHNENTPLLDSKRLSNGSYTTDQKPDESEYEKEIQTSQTRKKGKYLT